jgi:hypothetical protein
MTLNLSRVLAGLALSFVAACGAPGSYDICLERCDALLRCMYQNAAQTENCRTACTNNMGQAADEDNRLAKDCKNSGDIRKAQAACYDNGSCLSSQPAFDLSAGDCLITAERSMCIVP